MGLYNHAAIGIRMAEGWGFFGPMPREAESPSPVQRDPWGGHAS